MSNYIKMVDCSDSYLEHFGRKGMKWGEHIFGKLGSTLKRPKKNKYVEPPKETSTASVYTGEHTPKTARNTLMKSGYRVDPTYGWMTKQLSLNGKKMQVILDDSSIDNEPDKTVKKANQIEKDLPVIHKTAAEKIAQDYYDNDPGEWVDKKTVSREDFIKRLEPESIDEYQISYYSPDYTHWLSAEYGKHEGKYKAYYTSMNG